MDDSSEKTNIKKATVWSIVRNVLIYVALAGIIAATFVIASMN